VLFCQQGHSGSERSGSVEFLLTALPEFCAGAMRAEDIVEQSLKIPIDELWA
jgi:hypothetical protein